MPADSGPHWFDIAVSFAISKLRVKYHPAPYKLERSHFVFAEECFK
jgi:hypothetical protein